MTGENMILFFKIQFILSIEANLWIFLNQKKTPISNLRRRTSGISSSQRTLNFSLRTTNPDRKTMDLSQSCTIYSQIPHGASNRQIKCSYSTLSRKLNDTTQLICCITSQHSVAPSSVLKSKSELRAMCLSLIKKIQKNQSKIAA